MRLANIPRPETPSNLCRVPKLNYNELTQALLKEHVVYTPLTGEFIMIKTNSPRFRNKLPMKLGTHDAQGYLHAMVCGVRHKLHTLAVLYMTGRLPDKGSLEVVDHINGIKDDNRWDNLRVIYCGENIRNQRQTGKNTRSGVTGVYQRSNGNYMAHIRIDSKLHTLGTYPTLELAVAARLKALKAHLDAESLAYGRTLKGVA